MWSWYLYLPQASTLGGVGVTLTVVTIQTRQLFRSDFLFEIDNLSKKMAISRNGKIIFSSKWVSFPGKPPEPWPDEWSERLSREISRHRTLRNTGYWLQWIAGKPVISFPRHCPLKTNLKRKTSEKKPNLKEKISIGPSKVRIKILGQFSEPHCWDQQNDSKNTTILTRP